MNDAMLSPDGAWRWDGYRWVPNQPLPQRPTSGGLPATPFPNPVTSEPRRQSSLDWLVALALLTGALGLATIGVQLVGDTIRALGDLAPSEMPWYWRLWFVLVQSLIGLFALVLASLATFRKPSRLSAIAMSIAAGVFLQGVTSVYYRVVVSHLG